MHISPNHMSIGRIFEQNILFQVPKYQRYYAWDDEQVEDFIKDIDTIIKKDGRRNKGRTLFWGHSMCKNRCGGFYQTAKRIN